MFENVDGLTMDAGVTGKLIAHLGAFGSGELKSSENDQLTGHFQKFFFFFLIFSELFLISPETVKLVIGKPTVCIKSLNILSYTKNLDRTITLNSVILKNAQTEPQKNIYFFQPNK